MKLVRASSRAVILSILAIAAAFAQTDNAKLFLTPQRLHRLKRERERQTQRWVDFEAQIKAGSNSPERACEIAVYNAVVGDATADPDMQCPASFALPSEGQLDRFLLAMKPADVEHPTWQQHLQALALVNMDPNASSAQFLQGWAMEDRFEIHSGPGMVYELLWADPYLPGVSYQNMDPWFYDEHGTLIARASWDTDACWVSLSGTKVEQQNCPSTWQHQPTNFGTLHLIPATEKCVAFQRHVRNEEFILWKLKPGQKVAGEVDGHKQEFQADEGGLWRVPAGIDGKVCVGR